ncbi:prepilin peptidase [Tomitella biformata]|uniref:prepilin peptidase n=1 Tax=Tomitella biformata TaxID=630403 RepID=UPI00046355A4|nr:A24 family peptidase [Tomitella biformata]
MVARYAAVPRWQVSALCAAGCGLAALRVSGPVAMAAVALVLWCVCLSLIDLRIRRLPNSLTVTGAAVIGAFAVAADRWEAAALGAGLLAGAYLLGRLAGAGFGGGDVKLAVGLGGVTAMAGGQVWLWSAVGALILTAVAGLWRGCRARRAGIPVPHGPSMCVASLITLAALG